MSKSNISTNFTFLSPQRNSGAPKYASSTSIYVGYLTERDQFNQCNLTTTGAVSPSFTATGAGGILVSANLAGTVSVSSSSTTVTGTGTTFTSSFIVGDVINTSSGAQPIVSIVSDTTLTVNAVFTSTASGLTYTRGGLAPSCLYYLYTIAKPYGLSSNLAFSTRSIAAGDTFLTSDLPTGYTLYREMPLAVYINSSSTIKYFRVAEGWPYNPLILYEENSSAGAATWLYYGSPSTSSASPTVISGYDLPKNAKSMLINIWCTTAGTIYLVDALGTMQVAAVVSVNNQIKVTFPVGGPNTFSLYTTSGGGIVSIWCMGYYLHV